jgi:hypothetical protein
MDVRKAIEATGPFRVQEGFEATDVVVVMLD